MLGQLHIKNIGIIEDLTIDFEEALNIITGETGAGKSLVIDSIEAITGGRTSKELIRTGEDTAYIEAYFFTPSEEYILSREIHLNGKNICKVNGQMVTVGELKKVGASLIDLHGQHDNQQLLDETTHIQLLDAFSKAKLQDVLTKYTTKLEEYKSIVAQISQNYGDEQERARKIDLLNFQINEILSASLKIGEDEDLYAKRKIMQNSEKIANSLNTSHELLSEKILDDISEVTKSLNAITSIDEKFATVLAQINDAYYNLQDSVDTIADLAMEVDFDEESQSYIEERLDTITSLKRKYGSSIEEVLAYLDKTIKEKEFLENSEEIIQKLTQKKLSLENDLNSLADNISAIRKEQSTKIEKKVNSELQDLEMKKAYIKFQFETSKDFLENGKDIIQILICTNVGDELKPLSKIASGGELSRVMLAIKTVLGEYDKVPTMIFDEIDTGISGEAGKAVAEKLKIISKTHQVLCVTHLPSIAVCGDINFSIIKQVKNNKTKTIVMRLDEEEVIQEVARIIAGKDITESIISHVKEQRLNYK